MTMTFYSSIADISQEDFRAISPSSCLGSYSYYQALEESGCLSKEKGWNIHYLFRPSSYFIPLYLKYHSDGEFSYDHPWADIYQQHWKQSYYPKATVCLPFLPIEHQKIQTLAEIQILKEFVENHNLKSLHITFPLCKEYDLLLKADFIPRQHHLCYWTNHNYTTFDDFLQNLRSKYRCQIRKERQNIEIQGLEKEIITGAKINSQIVSTFFDLYQKTYLGKSWGNPPLNLSFFQKMVAAHPEHLIFFFLKRGDDYVAGSCNILEHNMLHGRFWGSQTDMPFIHFEVCYYMPLEYAIANNIARMEAGLCNLQKELRGFLPELKLNFHYFANSSFKSYIQSTLQEKSFKFINIYKEQ